MGQGRDGELHIGACVVYDSLDVHLPEVTNSADVPSIEIRQINCEYANPPFRISGPFDSESCRVNMVEEGISC